MNGAYLIIGGNMGDRMRQIIECRELIAHEIGAITKSSGVYETASWGNTDQPAYLNQVLWVQTSMDAVQLLKRCLKIERKMGRERNQKWESRLIDIDILLFNQDVVNEENLTIPHPYLEKRRFVLSPLCDIAPKLIHPILLKSIAQLLEECEDTLQVNLVQD